MPRRAWVVLAGATVLLAVACGTVEPRMLTPDQLRQRIAVRVPADELSTLEVPYQIDDDIRAFAHQATRGVHGDEAMARALVHSMLDRTGLSIAYDPEANKTAREVFRERRGNCLTFANLFVGMAREVGLDAVYVEEVTVQNTIRESDLIVNIGHVTAGVLGSDHLTVVDVNADPRPKGRGHRPIDDLAAMARFYNNEAYLHGFRAGDADAAIQWYRLVLEIDPRFYPAHNNLGVALKLLGKPEEAAREYSLALAANPDFAEARANLGAVLAAQGRRDDALRQFKLAIQSDPRSGQLRQQQGVLLLQARRYRDAEKSFRQALSREPAFAPAAVSLGEALLAQGRGQEALSAFRRALEIDPGNTDAQRRAEELAGER